jgi:hypothetical protein
MNSLRSFSQFIQERSDDYSKLVRLGLASRNQAFFNDLEKILELCPNLSYVTYPYSDSPGGMVKKIPSGDPELNRYRLMYSRLESDGELTQEIKDHINKLSRAFDFAKRVNFIENLALKKYGREYLDLVEDQVKNLIRDEFSQMMQTLREIDANGEVELKIWDIGGWKLRYNMFKKPNQQYIDTRDVVQELEQDPEVAEKIDKLQITVISEENTEFARRMSRGEYGSLD